MAKNGVVAKVTKKQQSWSFNFNVMALQTWQFIAQVQLVKTTTNDKTKKDQNIWKKSLKQS